MCINRSTDTNDVGYMNELTKMKDKRLINWSKKIRNKGVSMGQ